MPARVESFSEIASVCEPSVQLTNEGMFFFFGNTQVYAPLTPDTLARIPQRLREGMGIRLVLAMAATPWILKASSLLFTGARVHFWGSQLWSSLRDEWYGVINKAIPLLFDSPLLQRRLLIRFVHDQGDSRWEILRIPAVPMPAAWERDLNSLELVLYRLWRFMNHRQLNRLELRWDVEGRGWLSEFNRDKSTRVFWPEIMSTALEQELVAGEGRTVLQTLLHPERLLRLIEPVMAQGGAESSAEISAITWLEGRYASVLSFGDQAETRLVWLKDSACFSWQDSSLMLLRSNVSSESLLDEINHPAMTVWQYQSAPLVLPSAVAEWLVLEAASYLLDITGNAMGTLADWGTVKIMQRFHSLKNDQALVPKDIDNWGDRKAPPLIWQQLPSQTAVVQSGKPVAGSALLAFTSLNMKPLLEESWSRNARQHQGSNPSSNPEEPTGEKTGSSEQKHESLRSKGDRSPNDDGSNRKEGDSPDNPGSSTKPTQNIAGEKRGRKRAASEQLDEPPDKHAKLSTDSTITPVGLDWLPESIESKLADSAPDEFSGDSVESLSSSLKSQPSEGGSNEFLLLMTTEDPLFAVEICQADNLDQEGCLLTINEETVSYEQESEPEPEQEVGTGQQLTVESKQSLPELELENKQLKEQNHLLSRLVELLQKTDTDKYTALVQQDQEIEKWYSEQKSIQKKLYKSVKKLIKKKKKLIRLVSALASENECLKNNEHALKAEINKLTMEKDLHDRGQKMRVSVEVQTLSEAIPLAVEEVTDAAVDSATGSTFILQSTPSKIAVAAPDHRLIVSFPIASWLQINPASIQPASFEQVLNLAHRLELPQNWLCIGYRIKRNDGEEVTVKTHKDLNFDAEVSEQELDKILDEIDAKLVARSRARQTFLQNLGVRQVYRQAEAFDVLLSDKRAQIWLSNSHQEVEKKLHQLQTDEPPKEFSREERTLHKKWLEFKKDYPHVTMKNSDFDAFSWLCTMADEVGKHPNDKLTQLAGLWTDFSIHLAIERMISARKNRLVMPEDPFQWRRLSESGSGCATVQSNKAF